jgi:N-acetylneuraminic acid mutarotase
VGWTDPSGNVWLFGGIGIDAAGNFGYLNDLWEYTPGANGAAGVWTWMAGSSTVPNPYSGPSGVYGTLGIPGAANTPGGRFSPATWIDASGNLWLLSGQGYDGAGNQGYLNDLWRYTPGANGAAGEWTWMGGGDNVGRIGGLSGVYGTLGTPNSANVPGGRLGASSWIGVSGNLWFFGGQGYDSTGAQGNLNDLWKYQP